MAQDLAFESLVIDRVAELVGAEASFTSGTLFVATDEETDAIYLLEYFNKTYGEVEMNKCGDEYAYDFI
jgi:hypothetical protein